MRKLVYFTLGFCSVCFLCGYLLFDGWFLLVGLLCAVAALALFFVKADAAKIAAVFLFGAVFATLWCWGYDGLYLDGASKYDGQVSHLTVESSDYGYESDYSLIFEATAELSGIRYPVRVYLEESYDIAPGDKLTGDFYLRFTSNGDKNLDYLKGSGIVLVLYAKSEVLIERPNKIPLKYFPVQLRRGITEQLDALFEKDTAGFARALLIGDSTLLTYGEDIAFQISGIRHVIAVSGLHVSILFALVYLLCGKHRVLTAMLGIPILILFAFVAGLTPSILRACIMQAVMLLGMLLKREYDPPTALAASVLLILLINPLTVTSVSFQLSVGCMVGIFLFAKRLNRYLLRLLGARKPRGIASTLCKWLCGGISVTLSAMAVTTPLSTFYFNTVSIIGVVTNLAALWIVSFVFYGIMLSCIAGIFWIPLGKGIAWLASWGIRYVLTVSKLFAKLPIAAVYTDSVYIVMWLVFCYVLFALLLLSKRKRPVVTALCLAVSLVLAVAASWLEPRLDDVRVSVIDVGQGQSVLLQSGDVCYLVDCGGDKPKEAADKVARTLQSQGIFRLDGVILTHYDKDHAGGAAYLLQRVPADRLYLPDISEEGNQKEKLMQDFADIAVLTGSKRTEQGAWGRLTMLPGKNGKEENENSMCISFQAADCDILITGDRGEDGENALLAEIELPKLELLVAGHHGAPGSTMLPLLFKTKPQTVVISVGKDNIYGHPDKELLLRLALLGCQVKRTDIDGTVIFRR